jgi:hypothetical protein
MLLALWGVQASGADTARNPTVPPAAWLAAQPPVPGAPAVMSTDAPAGMQVILIGKTRKFAIIDGQAVAPGQTYNGSKVLAIQPGEVVLEDASKSLKATPGVEKKVIRPSRLKKSGGTARKSKDSAKGNGGSQ